MVLKKQEFTQIRKRIKELNLLLYSGQLLESDQVITAMKGLRDELNNALTRTEIKKYEELRVGDFYLNSDGVRKRKIQFDLDVGSVAVEPGFSAFVSCPAPSHLVKRIIVR